MLSWQKACICVKLGAGRGVFSKVICQREKHDVKVGLSFFPEKNVRAVYDLHESLERSKQAVSRAAGFIVESRCMMGRKFLCTQSSSPRVQFCLS